MSWEWKLQQADGCGVWRWPVRPTGRFDVDTQRGGVDGSLAKSERTVGIIGSGRLMWPLVCRQASRKDEGHCPPTCTSLRPTHSNMGLFTPRSCKKMLASACKIASRSGLEVRGEERRRRLQPTKEDEKVAAGNGVRWNGN